MKFYFLYTTRFPSFLPSFPFLLDSSPKKQTSFSLSCIKQTYNGELKFPSLEKCLRKKKEKKKSKDKEESLWPISDRSRRIPSRTFERVSSSSKSKSSIRGISEIGRNLFIPPGCLAAVYATTIAADKIMHTGGQIRGVLQEYRRPVNHKSTPLRTSLLAYLSNKSLSIIPLT